MKPKTIAELVKGAKDLGLDRVKLENTPPELLIDALVNYALTHYFVEDDAQILGMFYHYNFYVDGIEVSLETRNRITKEEAEAVKYTGLSLDEVRRQKLTIH